MERYLRFYIKFHGYVIATATILGSIFVAFVLYQQNDFHYPLEEFYDYRFMGSAGLIFGLIWFSVGVSMFFGIYKEVKMYLFPFAVMYMLDLFLLLTRDMILIWQNQRWYNMVFMNPVAGPVVFYITLHLMMTLVAMGKLFEHDPQAQSGSNFVRFKTDNRQRDANQPDEEVGDEASLVTG